MFDAPFILKRIPDIATIYAVNERQEAELDEAVEQLWNDIFLEDMGIDHIRRWENILKLEPLPDDSLEDRRYRIIAKLMEKLPYTRRTLRQKLDKLCPDGYILTYSRSKYGVELRVFLTLDSEKKKPEVDSMLERVLPLDIFYDIIVSTIQRQYANTYIAAGIYEIRRIAPPIREGFTISNESRINSNIGVVTLSTKKDEVKAYE